jgi:hypothetical protein
MMGPKQRAEKIATYFKKTKAFRVEPVYTERVVGGSLKFKDARPYYGITMHFRPAGSSSEELYQIRVLIYPTRNYQDTFVTGPHGGMVKEIREAAEAIR